LKLSRSGIERDFAMSGAVWLAVTRWWCVKTNNRMVMRYSLTGSPWTIFQTDFLGHIEIQFAGYQTRLGG